MGRRDVRLPSIRAPRSVWDLLAVALAYVALEYVVLRVTGQRIVRQELVVVAVAVFVWMGWAIYRILSTVE